MLAAAALLALSLPAQAQTCTDNDIDLVRGMDQSEGSVQICHDNQWRSVCDDKWNDNCAGVVCRQLGHATGTATHQSHFGAVYPVTFWLDEVICHGSEANLGACTHAGWGVDNCAFSERAGVQCTVAASGLTATGGDGQVKLAWDPPGDDGGITRHEYRYKTTGDYPAAWTAIPNSRANDTNEASYPVTGLASGTVYNFQLRIVGGDNASEPDEATTLITPTNLTATPGDKQVTLAWDAPPTNAVITRHEYRYKWATGAYTPWKAIPGSAQDGSNASSYTATKHVNLIDYVFQVRAVNAGGTSGPSNEAAATPLHADAPPAPTVEAPHGTAGLLEASWTTPTGSSYEVRFWPADEDGSTWRTTPTSDQSILIWPLNANTEYKVSVAAKGGPWSAPATARTGAPQSGRPVLSLYVLDQDVNEVSEYATTEGRLLFYTIKATNIRNYHNWGEPGVLGHFRLRWEWAEDRHPPHPVIALLNDSGSEPPRLPSCQTTPLMHVGLTPHQPDFRQKSATTGYWDFFYRIPDYAAELGPVRLTLQNRGCGSFPVAGPFLQAGSPNQACVEIADNGSGPAYDGSDPTMLDEKPTYSCAGQQRSSSSLKGRFVSAPERHDGTKRIKVRVAFSEAPANVGADGVEVEGGAVTSVSPVGGNAPGGAGTRSVGGRNCRPGRPGGRVGVRDRAGLARRRDGEHRSGTPVRRGGRDLHRGRAVAVGGDLDDGRGTGRGSAAADGVVRGRAGGA